MKINTDDLSPGEKAFLKDALKLTAKIFDPARLDEGSRQIAITPPPVGKSDLDKTFAELADRLRAQPALAFYLYIEPVAQPWDSEADKRFDESRGKRHVGQILVKLGLDFDVDYGDSP